MGRTVILAIAFTMTVGLANAADSLIGNWKTEDGATSAIAPCGSGYCITVKTGKYAGKKIAQFSRRNGNYASQITDPASNKTYNGTLKLSGNTVKMQGCLMKVFCQSQTWIRL